MITESTKALLAKTAPTVVIPSLAIPLHFDLIWVLCIFVGLVLGWLTRVGRLVHAKHAWEDIRRDLLVSILVGGGNGLLAVVIIFIFGFSYLQGIGVAFLLAFGGVTTIDQLLHFIVKRLKKEIGVPTPKEEHHHVHHYYTKGDTEPKEGDK